MREVSIGTEYIELGKLLKFGGAAQSGGAAKQWIEQGLVSAGTRNSCRGIRLLAPAAN